MQAGATDAERRRSRFSTLIYFNNILCVPAPWKRSRSELQTSLSGRRESIFTYQRKRIESRKRGENFRGNTRKSLNAFIRRSGNVISPVIVMYVLSRARTRAVPSRASSIPAS